MTMNVTIGDLTPNDIGRQVSIVRIGASITGTLTDLRVDTHWITEGRHGQKPDDWEQTPGRRSVTVRVGPWATELLPLDTPVEVDR